MAIGACGAAHSGTLLVAGTGLGPQLTHLLGQLAAGEIRIGLPCDGGCTGGLLPGCLAVLRHGIATGKHQGTARVLNGPALGRRRTALRTGGKLGGRCTQGSLFRGTLATAATALRGFSRDSCRSSGFGLTCHIGAVAIAAGVGGLATAGEGLTTGQNQIAARVALRLHLTGTRRCRRCEHLRLLRSCGSRDDGFNRGIGPGSGRTGISGSAHPAVTGPGCGRSLLTGGGERLAAFECEFATGESCHVRPRMWSMNGGDQPSGKYLSPEGSGLGTIGSRDQRPSKTTKQEPWLWV